MYDVAENAAENADSFIAADSKNIITLMVIIFNILIKNNVLKNH